MLKQGVLSGAACVLALWVSGLPLACSGSEPKETKQEPCDVPALLATSCAGRVCHGDTDPAAELDLVSTGLMERLVKVPSSTACGEKFLIEPRNPAASLLYEKVASDRPSCGRPMPPTGDRLTERELGCLREFIEEASGAPSYETCGGIISIDLMTDEEHCGTCEIACTEGQLCAEGQCIDPCLEGETLCGSSCVLLDEDPDHCGACGHPCGAGSTCQDAACQCDEGVSASFSKDVLPVLVASCGGKDCHAGDDTASSLRLTASEAYESLVAVGSDACMDRTRVVPGEPGSSYLMDKLLGGEQCTGRRMPLFDDPLPDDVVRKFVGWICAGAKDD